MPLPLEVPKSHARHAHAEVSRDARTSGTECRSTYLPLGTELRQLLPDAVQHDGKQRHRSSSFIHRPQLSEPPTVTLE